MSSEHVHVFGEPNVSANGQSDSNGEYVVASISNVIVDFENTGTDSSTTKYLGLGHAPSRILIRSDQDFMIVERNGVAYKDPITVPEKWSPHDAQGDTETSATYKIDGGTQMYKILIRTLHANQTLKIYING